MQTKKQQTKRRGIKAPWHFPEEYRSDLEEPSYSSEEDEQPFIAYHINDFNHSWDEENKHLNEKMRDKNKRELFKLTPTQIIAIWTVL